MTGLPGHVLVTGAGGFVGGHVVRRFAAEGISIPYPTQTSYTADPSGRFILPYPEEAKA